jgi:hypothetical protein
MFTPETQMMISEYHSVAYKRFKEFTMANQQALW